MVEPQPLTVDVQLMTEGITLEALGVVLLVVATKEEGQIGRLLDGVQSRFLVARGLGFQVLPCATVGRRRVAQKDKVRAFFEELRPQLKIDLGDELGCLLVDRYDGHQRRVLAVCKL